MYGWVLKRKKALVRAGFDKKGHLYGRVLKKRALVWVGFEEEEKALVWAGFEEEKKALVWPGFEEKRHLYGRAGGRPVDLRSVKLNLWPHQTLPLPLSSPLK